MCSPCVVTEIDIKTERFWSYDLDLIGSRDVIGHVAIGYAVSYR